MLENILSYFGTYTPASGGVIHSFRFEYLTTLGFDELSVSPGSLLQVREIIRTSTMGKPVAQANT